MTTHQFKLETPNPTWPDWLDPYLSASPHTDHSIYRRKALWYLCTKRHGEQIIPIDGYITLNDKGQLHLSVEPSPDVEAIHEPNDSLTTLVTPTPKAITDLGIDLSNEPKTPKPPTRKPKTRRRKPIKKD